MPDVIILQRLVTHYRLPLFERLWREFGWVVVTSRTPPRGTHLNLVEGDHDFIQRFDSWFPDPPMRAIWGIPVGGPYDA